MKSVKETDQESLHQADIWVEEDHLQEENVPTDEDHTPALRMENTEEEERTQASGKESTETEIVTVSTRRASAETVTDQDLERRSTEREDKADQTPQESERIIPRSIMV